MRLTMNQLRVIGALVIGRATRERLLRRAVHPFPVTMVSRGRGESVLERLVNEGLLCVKEDTFELTDAGRSAYAQARRSWSK